MLIATITDRDPAEVRARAEAAARHADLLEIRLDRLSERGRARLDDLFAGLPRPAIAACRRVADGGAFAGAEEDRTALLRRCATAGAAYVDVEAGTPAESLIDGGGRAAWLLSRHDPEGMPADLEAIAARLRRRPGVAYVKLVCRARRLRDCLRLRDLLGSDEPGAPLIAFAMGEPGQVSRLLARAWGSAATYGSAGGEPGAPGQIGVEEMERIYGVRRVGRGTALAAVVGRPLGGSLSPRLHNDAYRHLGVDACYLPAETGDPEEALGLARGLGMRGLSVTMPLKEAILPHLDALDPAASRIGAVNTVVLDGGRATGFNTDAIAAARVLGARLRLAGAQVAVVGAGGAARAVVHALCEAGARVTIFNRTEARARDLAAAAGASWAPLPALASHPYRLLVHATPAGMAPDGAASAIPAEWLRGECVVDLVYAPRRTRLLREASRRGIEAIDGLGIFVEQAALQFRLFTGREAPRERMRQTALRVAGPPPGKDPRDG
jgi:3-dehydroquinate dehydratase/shikimate dehydrogenase